MLDKKNISLLGLILGIIVFLFFNITSPPEGLDKISWLTAGVAILMTIWWVTEAIPIYATGLVPLLLFPLLDLFDLKDHSLIPSQFWLFDDGITSDEFSTIFDPDFGLFWAAEL